MNKNNPTSKEHFVPRTYLNGFASDDKRVYFYDLNTHHYSDQMVPISTICYEKDLYEYKNKDNEIINVNLIEKILAALESQFAQNREAIKTRIKIANPHTKSFISDNERNFWVLYIAVQILRMPKVIEEITKAISGFIPSNGDINLHRNTALFLLLPFLRKLEPDNFELKLFNEVLDGIGNLHCLVAYDDQHRLFTSDCPLYLYSPTKKISDCKNIVYPIDSSLCFLFSENEISDNTVMPIDNVTYEYICKSISYSADRRLFRKTKFTKQELKWIRSAREDKTKDKEL